MTFGLDQSSESKNDSQSFHKQQNMFPGVDVSYNSQTSDTIQRELMEGESIRDISPDVEDAAVSDKEEVSDENLELPQEVTPRDLDILAEKLMPRIKRMIRAESERSIFR